MNLCTRLVLFLLLSLPRPGVGQTVASEDLLDQINRLIDAERYEAGLELLHPQRARHAFAELDCYEQGRILHKIGVCHYLLNQEEDAIRVFRDSVLERWSDCPAVPVTERANTLYNIGVSLQYLNQPERAKTYLDKALSFFESEPEYPLLDMAAKYYGMGNFYHAQYDAFRAELYYENALALYRREPNTVADQFYLLNDLIAMSMTFKNYQQAEYYIEEALSLQERHPSAVPDFDLALVFLNAGISELELGKLEQARDYGQMARDRLDSELDPYFTSIALELLAMIQAEQGAYEEGLDLMRQVLQIRNNAEAEGQADQALATAHENMADILLRQGKLDEADDHLKRAFTLILVAGEFDKRHVPLIDRSKARDDTQLIRLLEIQANVWKAHAKASGDPAWLHGALELHYKIDSVIDQNLVNLQFEGSRLNFLELKYDHYQQAIQVALQLYKASFDLSHLEDAYYFSSKTKAIVLQYQVNQAEAVAATADPDVAAEEKDLRKRMYALQRKLLEAAPDSDTLLRTYLGAQHELEAFIRELESRDPSLFKKRYALIRPPRARSLHALLPKDLALVEFFQAEDSIYSFWIARDAFFVEAVARDNTWKEDLDTFLDACLHPGQPYPVAQAVGLYRLLLRPGLGKLPSSIGRLCFIPDGDLHALPFEALLTGAGPQGPFLIEDFTISYAYAVGLLQGRSQRKIKDPSYVGFGTTYSPNLSQKLREDQRFFGDQNLSRLMLSRREIEQGTALFKGEAYLDEEASRTQFLRHSPSADILHLSLHGLVDKEDPGRSCLIFDDRHDSFVLSALDLYVHPIQADLVLLSACHSASGRILRGEGVQGLSKAFMLSGARNILSSLWSASEASSLRITTNFLEGVQRGESKADALRSAKLDYLARASPSQRHPFYWANFILVGDLDRAKASLPITSLAMIFAGPLALALLFWLTFRTQKRDSA